MNESPEKKPPQDLLDWLGISDAPNWRVARLLGGMLGAILVVAVPLLFFGALFAAGGVLWHTVALALPGGNEGINLGAGALIAALLGAPFVIWGTVLKHRALDLSNASFFNDKINDALASLYSRRQETRSVTHDGEEQILTEWKDDILQRSAAIDRLEGLAREKPSEAPRIADMLSVYIRELSRTNPALEHRRTKWVALVEPEDDSEPMSESEALSHLGLHPDDVTIEALQNWSRSLRPYRTDVEKAAQTLGRLKGIPGVDAEAIRIDLRGANLQHFDLAARQADGLDAMFSGAKMAKARLEGAFLDKAHLEDVNLANARMEGARLDGARMQGARLRGTRLEGASLRGTQIEGVALWKTNLTGAEGLSPEQLATAFGDGSVTLPEGMDPPAHWPDCELDWETLKTERAKWRASRSA